MTPVQAAKHSTIRPALLPIHPRTVSEHPALITVQLCTTTLTDHDHESLKARITPRVRVMARRTGIGSRHYRYRQRAPTPKVEDPCRRSARACRQLITLRDSVRWLQGQSTRNTTVSSTVGTCVHVSRDSSSRLISFPAAQGVSAKRIRISRVPVLRFLCGSAGWNRSCIT